MSAEPPQWQAELTKEELVQKLNTTTKSADHLNGLLRESEATNVILMEQIKVSSQASSSYDLSTNPSVIVMWICYHSQHCVHASPTTTPAHTDAVVFYAL